MEQPGFFPEQDPLVDDQLPDGGLRIKIIGVGGAGTNAVDRIKLEDLEQVHLTVVDTDSQVLSSSPVEESFLLGKTVTLGKSSGGSVEKGRMAAEADREFLQRLIKGVDLVFILSGLGGGTGSGAAPVLADLAAEEGALVIAFVAMPFQREGNARGERARNALETLQKSCHAVISLPNDLIFKQVDDSATLMEAFAMADKWIKLGVHSIWSMLFNTGLINVDFSTLQSALAQPGGKTLFGTGYGKGDDLVEQALDDLLNCPLLHLPDSGFVKDTDQLIVNLTGGPDLTMAMVNKVMDAVSEKFGCRNSIVMGASIDGSFYNQLRITVMGTLRRVPSVKGYDPVPSASIPPNEPVAPPLKRPAPELELSLPPDIGRKQQEEFAFPRPEDNRGVFEKTGRNIYEGDDLDIPTYLRREIKIPRG
ncbi:cell division protein FtsZ [Puniceicoccales bacterium CK1056]|uniref:Cell division protein FtsZ n=1 Tax=Oceanipulchritudo coccoides TaxID=2706888 RepID=A0A6B2M2V2_9BACT|nr:cell division protein FtsZ [Oceanipulchritudo coccoides]NDV63288.1 cell division protein FtsZ [Oceanipulchritudo coccoides]